MTIGQVEPQSHSISYHGLRMTAEEYLALGPTEQWYELIDGLVHMSPSPTPRHQRVAARIAGEISEYLSHHPVGEVFVEVDVSLGRGPLGGDLVYRPDIVFLRAERAARNMDRITEPPDLVVEIVSPLSRRFDHETKKADYERAGVREYWIIDPEERTTTFYRLEAGRYVQVQPVGQRLASLAIPGFQLDLVRVRSLLEPPA